MSMTEWKQKRRHMIHYNCIAHLYNTRYAEEQTPKIAVSVATVSPLMEDSVLDLGCGTGLLISRLRILTKNVVGLDVSKNMLKDIDSTIRRATNVHLVLADADFVPLRKNAFDAVFAITLLQNMPNPKQTLREMRYAAKHNASIIVTGLKKRFSENAFRKLFENTKLKTELLNTVDNLNCYVAACHEA